MYADQVLSASPSISQAAWRQTPALTPRAGSPSFVRVNELVRGIRREVERSGERWQFTAQLIFAFESSQEL